MIVYLKYTKAPSIFALMGNNSGPPVTIQKRYVYSTPE